MDMKDNITKGAVYGVVICIILLVLPVIAIATKIAPLMYIVMVVVGITMLIPIGVTNTLFGFGLPMLPSMGGGDAYSTEFIIVAVVVYAIGGAIVGYIYDRKR